jgi:hypothetical protein
MIASFSHVEWKKPSDVGMLNLANVSMFMKNLALV